MPQRAILDGKETVYAFEASAEVWDGLSAAYAADCLSLPCCGSPAIPKVNAHGTRWFAHRPYARIACDWKATDARHEAVVAAISAMAKERGWDVETEARGEGWRADVLCRRPKANIRVAFQIELLRREEADILVDSAALQAASIATWWIFPGRRKHSIPTLPRVGTVRTGDGANTVGEGAAFAARVLNGVERAFIVANSVIRALKSAGWDYETRFDMGIPACISATDPTDGHGVEIKVGSKVDLGFMVRGEASARRRNAEAQEQLVSLFRERLDRGIELWWPNYPRLDAETFRPLREAINTQRPAQFTRTTSPAPATRPVVAPAAASVGTMEPWMEEAARQPPPEWRPNWAREVDAASEPRRPRYFDPVPGLMAAAERGEIAEPADLNEWGALRASHILRAAETVMSPAEAAIWMHTRNVDLGGLTPHEAAAVSSQALEACEVVLGIRDPVTLAKIR